MNILAIIPARANSGRVPGKNTMLFGGKPCLWWTIQAVRECSFNPHIVVVTDDPVAEKIASILSVDVVPEPPPIAESNDLYDVVGFVLRAVQGDWEAIMLAYANIPIRPPGLFDRLVDTLLDDNPDCVGAFARHRGHMGGSVFSINYMNRILVDRLVVDDSNTKMYQYQQDEIVEIDTPEDVTWVRTLITARECRNAMCACRGGSSIT